MNAIALFLLLVLSENPTCQSQPANEKTISGQSYAVQTYQCYWSGSESSPSHTFEVWSPVCPHYVDQPILLSERNRRKGWVMNEFGEFYPATYDVDLMHVYRPRCGGLYGETAAPSHGAHDVQLHSTLRRAPTQ